MTNPEDLIPDQNHVVLQLTAKGKNITGTLNGKTFRATCKKSQLSNIFLARTPSTNNKRRGHAPQTGALVSKNALVIQLHQQNAMMDWSWLVFVHRKKS